MKIEPEILGWLEALLFASGEGLTAKEMANAVGLSVKETEDYLRCLSDSYEQPDRGLRLVCTEGIWQLSTKPALFPILSRWKQTDKNHGLSHAAFETLAIVAYRQPVTRVDIEAIRGVSSSSSIHVLLDRELIQEAGRKDAPGRPFYYKTTPQFLKALDMQDISELPDMASFEQDQES
ncbi:SMC-Scp complex subunit ScpB [Pseudoramibacter sp.]|jgi:segregation and condensation protein B|uniref:SMC-Scp complex subunit ScpB n=1 Tax=Pseudoramibacter sp. TaxID=2034862 RepID=UPI0025F2BA94|nr:SMC-Scp complex subunit ScpB [Pseudoramibacter sp.]MCH4072639.1 SMC-Scp complex subunit ScpB [Pseudoramibacter sp.]MCH4106410.1 SMC-Scp complex subunit ScpB [Pseudoramibacter sp.]